MNALFNLSLLALQQLLRNGLYTDFDSYLLNTRRKQLGCCLVGLRSSLNLKKERVSDVATVVNYSTINCYYKSPYNPTVLVTNIGINVCLGPFHQSEY